MATIPWLYFTATFDLSDIEGAPMSAYVKCTPETPLVWAATGQTVPDASKEKGTYNGRATFLLPFTDQPGFTAGAGGASIIGFGYRFDVRPTRSKAITSTRYVQVPRSLGSTVRIGNLVDIGAWPNATNVIVTPGGGTGGGTTTLTLVPAPGQPAGYFIYA